MSDDIRDERLSRLYREAEAAAPPEALDRAILAASRAALAPARRRARWQAWTLPMGVAATLVLTVTLTLLVQREQEPPLGEAPLPRAPAAAPQERAEPGAELPAKTAAPPAAKREAVRREAEAPPPAPTPAASRPASQPPVVEQKALPAPAPEAVGAAEPARPAAAMRRQSAPAADAVEMRAKSAPLRKEAAGAAAARTPEQWLEEIRQLKAQGRDQQAAEALAEFRQAYPDYRLPEDLR
ncbi:hypothetical protein RHDC1_02071 [Rhodocyclaceae bacterium]|nr:hypothetical protein RHDC1_02071 [Rhodocyclaceae bacterium]